MNNEKGGHFELIKCPECLKNQSATVLYTSPFWTYTHECECGFMITESDWEKIETI